MNNYAERWKSPQGQQLAAELFARLKANRSVKDLRLGEIDGRIDVRGIPRPPMITGPEETVAGLKIRQHQNQTLLRGARLEGYDFSSADLNMVKFFDTRIHNCIFDSADCHSIGLWDCDVKNTSFCEADLRDAVLGGKDKGRGCRYQRVTFDGANMGGVVCRSSAVFEDCNFGKARISKTEFDCTTVRRCTFAGDLREVTFYGSCFKSGRKDPDALRDVSFRESNLSWVEFRQLNLKHVDLPVRPGHLVISNYRCVMERAASDLGERQDRLSRIFATLINDRLKWIGPQQSQGLFNLKDITEIEGEVGAGIFERMLTRYMADCAQPG